MRRDEKENPGLWVKPSDVWDESMEGYPGEPYLNLNKYVLTRERKDSGEKNDKKKSI